MENIQLTNVSTVNNNSKVEEMHWGDRYIAWLESKKEQRLAVLGKSFLFHGNITIPFTFLSMELADGGDWQFLAMFLLTVILLVVNLTAQPVKITIPVFQVITAVFALIIVSNLLSWIF